MMVVLASVCAAITTARADSARDLVREGNQLYGDGQYAEAAERYEQAQAEQPGTMVPQFNQAASQYQLDELDRAMELYQQVAAESKEPALVAKAKYNLGNCLFQRGVQQAGADPQKAIEDLKASVGYWRQARDLDPQNTRAARNMEVAKRKIQEIRQQQQQQNQQQKNDPQDQEKQDEQKQDQSSEGGQDPNAPPDPNEPQQQPSGQDPNQPRDPNESQQEPQPQEQGEEKEEQFAPDATAQEILDREQRLKEQRQIRMKGRYQEVEKDW
jgi:Ca-activated chloride channel family protein